jgi:branched-chain amino acid transport system ATP-binding protein
MTGTTSLLRVGGIDAGYGDVKVLYDVSVSIEPGAITALVGSNAAGKTTLMRAISGLIPVTRGTIEFDSVDVTRNRPSDRVLAGICLVPEGRMIFSDLSVEENLAIGAFIPRVRAERRQLVEELYERYPVLRRRAANACHCPRPDVATAPLAA